MSDMRKTMLQESGAASALGDSLAEIMDDVLTLGIDPRSAQVHGGLTVRAPSGGER